MAHTLVLNLPDHTFAALVRFAAEQGQAALRVLDEVRAERQRREEEQRP
ncbi:MAG: hypothetical protein HYU66_23200 [Armatimonadetes bacterium]|nr:hypothetical protein [Armatimonadota bacterium]